MAYTLLEFARAADADLRAVSTDREDATRRQQGWSATDLPSLRIELLPRDGWVGFVQRIFAIIRMRYTASPVPSGSQDHRHIAPGTVAAA